MSYGLMVVFSTSDDDEHTYDLILRDFIFDDEWSNLNYWDDISSLVSHLISEAEKHLRSMYPDGHDYSLKTVHVFPVNPDDEEFYK